MKITTIELVQNKRPIPLPEPWRPAWNEPDTDAMDSIGFSFYRVHTDEGITGIGPCGRGTRPEDVLAFAETALVGTDPAFVESFFNTYMRGHGTVLGRPSLGGLEIALWDIIGKAAGMPVYRCLGACKDRVPAYAATCQLRPPEESVDLAREIQRRGFKALKLRLHRPRPEQDVEVVRAVREALGKEMTILVDANQNHTSPNYSNWSRRTALKVARELDDLDVFWLEEPLPRSDVEGLAELCRSVNLNIAGAEHAATIYDFRDVLHAGAYDIAQPDVVIGHIGISGIRKVAVIADAVGRQIAPHVCTNGNSGLHLAATLQALGTVHNCPWLEYAFDPPSLVPEILHGLLENPILIDEHGCVPIPQAPGIGVAIDEEMVGRYT